MIAPTAAMREATFAVGDRVSIGGLTEGEIIQVVTDYRESPDSEPIILYRVEYQLWPGEAKRWQWSSAGRLILRERLAEHSEQERAA